jgi:hypothetical protein
LSSYIFNDFRTGVGHEADECLFDSKLKEVTMMRSWRTVLKLA